jgi:hypothetical protein
MTGTHLIRQGMSQDGPQVPYRNHDRHYRQHFGNSVHHLRTPFRHHPKICTTL